MTKRTVRALSRAVDNTVLLTLLVILILAGYSLWDTHQVFEAAKVEHYQTYKPVANDTKSFEELQAINPEVIGWLTIYGTGIDYPTVQSQKNNDYYLNRNPENEFDSCGSLYYDHRCDPYFNDFNTIIMGHHMAEHRMFGDLDLFLEEGFFNTHQYGDVFFNGQNHGIELFAVITADAYDDIIYQPKMNSPSEREQYLSYIYQKAKYTRNAEVTTNDRLLVMSTCSSDITNGRTVVVGKLLNTTVENPFAEEEEEQPQNAIDLFNIWNSFMKLPVWVWILILMVAILLLWLLYNAEKRRLKKKQEKRERHESDTTL